MERSKDYWLHLNPVWRERANFIIHVALGSDDAGKFEQLWVRQIDETTFEVCCIPFAAYNLALGDIVTTGLEGDGRYVLKRVAQPSGRWVFRVVFFKPQGTDYYGCLDRTIPTVLRELEEIGCLFEWSSSTLMAVDVIDEDQAKVVADLLMEHEQRGELRYETGWL